MNHHCAKCHTNILKNMNSINIFPFFAIFAQNYKNVVLFYPKIANFGTYSAWNYD